MKTENEENKQDQKPADLPKVKTVTRKKVQLKDKVESKVKSKNPLQEKLGLLEIAYLRAITGDVKFKDVKKVFKQLHKEIKKESKCDCGCDCK